MLADELPYPLVDRTADAHQASLRPTATRPARTDASFISKL